MMHSMNGADNGKKNTDGRSPGRNRRKSDGCSTGVTANYIYIKYAWYEFRAMMKG